MSTFRTLSLTTVLLALLLVMPFGKTAFAWEPDGPVEFIVPGSAGGGYDRAARALQKVIEKHKLLNVPFNVINRPGGGGNIGLNYLLGKPADGRSMLIASTAILANHITGRSDKTYSDLTTLVNLFDEYITTSVNADSALADPKVFIDRLKNDPRSLSVGFCCTRGGGNHLAAALLVKQAGGNPRDLTIVVYKGSGEVVPAILGDHIKVASVPASNVLGQVEEGTMKFVGIASPVPLAGRLAGVPIWRDHGLDVVIGHSRVLFAQPGLSDDKRKFWEDLYEKVSNTPEWREVADNNLWRINYLRGDDTIPELKSKYELVKSLLDDVGMLKK